MRIILSWIERLLTSPVLILWRLMGWHAEGQFPAVDRLIMIAVPHTSNWDYFMMIPLAIHFRLRPTVLIKSSAFRWPVLGAIIRTIGAIPIERGQSANQVENIVAHIHAQKRISLVITPEGTRGKTDYWRSGFYHIAYQAGIPIVPGYLDYKRKVGGVGEALIASGDIEADMVILADFYATHGHGKHPDRATSVRLKPHGDD